MRAFRIAMCICVVWYFNLISQHHLFFAMSRCCRDVLACAARVQGSFWTLQGHASLIGQAQVRRHRARDRHHRAGQRTDGMNFTNTRTTCMLRMDRS